MIPADGSVTVIGEEAFENNDGLTAIVIPEGVTTVSAFAFSKCANLTTVTVPASVTSIGEGAFLQCTRILTVNYGADEEAWGKIEIGSRNTYLTGAAAINYTTPVVE